MDKFSPLVNGSDLAKNEIIFKFYDIDRDNELSVLDLLQLRMNISEYCKLDSEIKKLTTFYVEKHILKKDKKNNSINLKVFLENILNHD